MSMHICTTGAKVRTVLQCVKQSQYYVQLLRHSLTVALELGVIMTVKVYAFNETRLLFRASISHNCLSLSLCYSLPFEAVYYSEKSSSL